MIQWGREKEKVDVDLAETDSRLESMEDLRRKAEAVLEQLTLPNQQGGVEVRDDLSRQRFLILMRAKQYGRLRGAKARELREISVVDNGETSEVVLLEQRDPQTDRIRQFSINPLEEGEIIYLQSIHLGVVTLINDWNSFPDRRFRTGNKMEVLISSLLATDRQVR